MKLAAALGITSLLVASLAAPAAFAAECHPSAPDSVQISWSSPCDDGSWLLDPETGCRMWDWHPAPEDTVTWSGTCRAGSKEGPGVLQWFEHGRPIDRFEGVFRHDQRTGFGRYHWPLGDVYEGLYDADLPHGQGTARIAGETFTGVWRRGCFSSRGKTVAIGVPLAGCEGDVVAEHAGR